MFGCFFLLLFFHLLVVGFGFFLNEFQNSAQVLVVSSVRV